MIGAGLTLCPGKKDLSRDWDRDLDNDLTAIRQWGVKVVGLIRALGRVFPSLNHRLYFHAA